MAFQPILDVDAGRVYAYEALVRGPSGEPAFTVLAKVTDANRYAFDQSCRVKAITMAKALGVDKTPAKLSINFIPGAVYNAAACIRLTLEAARQQAFPLDRIIFEITEGEKVKDRDHLRTIFDEYRRHGFQMALDDFGAGFCGFDLFADLTPDIVKLDMALVRDLHKRSVAFATVRSLVELCHKLSVTVIAEGIETREEFYALRSCGVRYMQGYLFARPAFEHLPGFSMPNGEVTGNSTQETATPMGLPLLPDAIKGRAQQVPFCFTLANSFDWQCLQALTERAASNLAADGSFLLINQAGRLTTACQFGKVGIAEVETLQFVVDAGPARGFDSVVSHSLADRSTFVTVALHHDGTFLGVLGVSKATSTPVTAAQECVLQAIAVETSAELERERGASEQPPPTAEEDFGSIDRQLHLLQSVVVNANDSILITEAEPIDDPGPRILYANPAFTQLTGYTMEEVLGKTPRLLQGPSSGREARIKIREALAQWKPVQVELLNYKKDGTEFWVDLSISPVSNAQGWYTHWVSVQRDVTQRKEKEAYDLGKTQSALLHAEWYASRGRLAATTAHEINNPLEAVTNLVYIAKTHAGITSEVSEILDLADQQLERVGRIAQRALSYYREVPNAEIVDVGEVMAATASVYEALISSKHIRLEQQRSGDLRIFAASGDLKQIFSNLLVNAIDATPKGGTIIMRVHASTDEADSVHGVRVVIADSGRGISSEVQANAFSAFTTKAEHGTGIGLWITKSLIEKCGGSIRFRSQQGTRCGTSMRLFFPSARRSQKERRDAKNTPLLCRSQEWSHWRQHDFNHFSWGIISIDRWQGLSKKIWNRSFYLSIVATIGFFRGKTCQASKQKIRTSRKLQSRVSTTSQQISLILSLMGWLDFRQMKS